ncbi:MarR family transcriptional regulator [Nocardioides sp. BGMRC 2183]|nr:MarR family transcriptional regulator [Nocardioides sp. BGMRC 2183]
MGDQTLGVPLGQSRELVEERVPAHRRLAREQPERIAWPGLQRGDRRHRHRDHPTEQVVRVGGDPVRGDRSPVVADQDGSVIPAQLPVQVQRIGHQRGRVVDTVAGQPAWRVATGERRHRAISRLGEDRTEVPPGVRGVGKAVQQQCQRSGLVARVAPGEAGEPDPRQVDHERLHGVTVRRIYLDIKILYVSAIVPRVRDEVDDLIEAWARERADLDLGPVAVFSRISRLAHHLDKARRASFTAHGIESWEFDVLAALRRAGDPYELSPGKLLRETLVTSGTMTNRVDRLVQRGLVERNPDPSDRRGVLVRLTPEGKDAVDGAFSALLTAERDLLSGLPESDRTALAGLLRQLLAPFGS